MKVAFYAPLKWPGHPVPSGDRLIAGLLARALRRGGHEVELVSRLRSLDVAGSLSRQRRIARLARRSAARLIERWAAGAAHPPECWLTYHLYHKAPDWIGPRVSRALDIPYLVVEPSHAAKQREGSWRHGHRAGAIALRGANRAIVINRSDAPGLRALGLGDRIEYLAPFIDTERLDRTGRSRSRRTRLARVLDVAPAQPWLVAVAMMRPGRKVDSFLCLADALEMLLDRDWHCLVVGGGVGREAVERRFRSLESAGRVSLLGERPPGTVRGLLHAADCFVWPAIGEPLGMAMLEAQGAGLPVVAGDNRGVSDLVEDGVTGLLVPPGDAGATAGAIRRLIRDSSLARRMGLEGRRRARARHSLDAAARALDAMLRAP